MTSKLKKITYHKLGLNDTIKKQNQNFTKNPRTKILKKDWIQNLNKLGGNTEILHSQQNFKWRGKKRKGRNKMSLTL